MDSLVYANVKQRPLRTAVSMFGVALGVILVVLTVGLARGMMRDTAERQLNVDAEIRFLPSGDVNSFFDSGANPLRLPERFADAFMNGVHPSPENPDVEPKPPIKGIVSATAVGEYLQSGETVGGTGFEIIDGINYDTFAKTTQIELVDGKPFTERTGEGVVNEAIVDRFYAEKSKGLDGEPVGIGSQIMVFGRPVKVVGIYKPSLLGRIKIPLHTLQDLFGGAQNCSFIMLKAERPEFAEDIKRRLEELYPGYNVLLTKDMPALYSQGVRPVEIFLNVVIWLSVVISVLVILLSMYTTIMERTREIGILKSLGASKAFIVIAIEKEAALISVLGVATGFVLAVIGKYAIEFATKLLIDIEPRWLLISAALGIMGGLVGAIYPALRAANFDPIEALSHE